MAYRNYGPAHGLYVSQDGNGDFVNIEGALDAAVAGDTIFIGNGTYTESLLLKPGVNLTAWGSDSSLNGTGTVIINGDCTLDAAGTVTISGIQLDTNSNPLITISGTAASIVNLNNCNLNCTNNPAISYSTSSASSAVNLYDCTGNLGTTGIKLFASSSPGILTIQNCSFTNIGGSSTASTISAGYLYILNSNFESPITTSGTNALLILSSYINTQAQNVTCLTVGGSGSNGSSTSNYTSGTATTIVVTSTFTTSFVSLSSSATNAVSGSGTYISNGVAYTSSSNFNAASTQTGGAINGITSGNNPSAGFLGEQIISTVGITSASLSTGSAGNITSIMLTAGVWDVSGLVTFTGGAITGVNYAGSVSLVSATRGTQAYAEAETPTSPTTTSNVTVTIPKYRVNITSTTPVYLVGFATFSVGSLKAGGTIFGTRVG
jgi:hypothetical protein